jgi:hypothetical protein
VNSAPDKNKFINIEGTPAYILMEPDKSMELINEDVYICSAEVEGKIRRTKVSMKTVGGVYGAAGLFALIDLATTGGVFASLFIPTFAVITAVGWTTYASADAVSELSVYKNLEICLEEKDYSVVFFIEEEGSKSE